MSRPTSANRYGSSGKVSVLRRSGPADFPGFRFVQEETILECFWNVGALNMDGGFSSWVVLKGL